MCGCAWLTVELSPVSLQGVLFASFFVSPAKKARQRYTPVAVVVKSADV